MSAYFCGNPYNHPPHVKNGMDCAGVDRNEVKEEVVEKFVPTEMAEDGTSYVKVTVIVEDLKTGDARVLVAERASRDQIEVKAQEYVPWHHLDKNWQPVIESVVFSFMPNPLEGGVAFTMQDVKNEMKEKN